MSSSPRPTAPGGFPWLTAAVAVAATGVSLWPALAGACVYDRTALAHGEVWRLWTAHLVHFGASHLAWNLLVFVPAAAGLERGGRRALGLLLAIGAPVIGVALFVGEPAMLRYGGLSGLIAGVLTALAFDHWRAERNRWFWAAVMLALAAKIGLEIASGDPLLARFAADGIRPAPLAHLAGMLGGFAMHRAGRRGKSASA